MLEVPSHQQVLKALLTLNFSCPAVLTSIDFEPFALTVLLTCKKSLGFHLYNPFV
jgi:hypothetical protein